MVTLDEFKKKHSDKCRLIGLDLGSKRIGVSICDEKQLIATPFRTIVKTDLLAIKNRASKQDSIPNVLVMNYMKVNL